MNTLQLYPIRICYMSPGNKVLMLHYLRPSEEVTVVSAPSYDPSDDTWDISVMDDNKMVHTIAQTSTYDKPWLVSQTPPTTAWMTTAERQPKVGQVIQIAVNKQPKVITWTGTEKDVDVWRMMTDSEIYQHNVDEGQKQFN